MKLEDGTILNLDDRISDRLYENIRVWVIFEDFSSPQKPKNTKKNSKK